MKVMRIKEMHGHQERNLLIIKQILLVGTLGNVSPATETKDPSPKPNVSIAVAPSGIVLSWYMALEERHAPIMN